MIAGYNAKRLVRGVSLGNVSHTIGIDLVVRALGVRDCWVVRPPRLWRRYRFVPDGPRVNNSRSRVNKTLAVVKTTPTRPVMTAKTQPRVHNS